MTDLREKLLQEDGVKTYMEHLASVLDRESRIVLFGAGTGGMHCATIFCQPFIR